MRKPRSEAKKQTGTVTDPDVYIKGYMGLPPHLG
jgi:hypothetical protein